MEEVGPDDGCSYVFGLGRLQRVGRGDTTKGTATAERSALTARVNSVSQCDRRASRNDQSRIPTASATTVTWMLVTPAVLRLASRVFGVGYWVLGLDTYAPTFGWQCSWAVRDMRVCAGLMSDSSNERHRDSRGICEMGRQYERKPEIKDGSRRSRNQGQKLVIYVGCCLRSCFLYVHQCCHHRQPAS